MPSITSIDATNTEDLRQIARRRIPRALFDYVDRGSYDELTLRSNRSDLDAIRLRQRVLVDVSKVTLATSMLGEPVSMPVAIAPTGMTGLIHGNGEMLGARAAEAAGTKFCLSTMSICTIEDVREVVEKPFWFQLYVFRDRGFSSSVIERARAANCSALFVTVDLPKRAASVGVDAIVVSNHGGRQLDGARSSIASLPDIANAVGDRIEVLFDGGIRSGQDVMKALASGARGCLIGRAFLYGLAAGGEAGVRRVLELIRAELEVSMALTGQCDIQAITRDVIAP